MLHCDPASSHGGHTMKLLAAIGVLFFVSVPAHAQTAKPCEELKDEITKKLDAKGVKGYTLDIVAKDKDAEGKVVGTCDGGTKKIIFTKTSAPPKPRRSQHPSPNPRSARPPRPPSFRTEQADFFFPFHSCERVGLRREESLCSSLCFLRGALGGWQLAFRGQTA